MHNLQNPNLELLAKAVEQLGSLVEQMVFLGGCATGLLITDPAAPPIRMTRDVDALIQVLSLTDYRQLEKSLRLQGFKEDTSDGAPICRWIAGHMILDILPTDPQILGFGNIWYLPASQHAISTILSSGKAIRHVSAPYFLITKLEAFKGRGQGDYLMSHDIEDIIAVLDGRPSITQEVHQSDHQLVSALAIEFQHLLGDRAFLDAIPAHMPTDNSSQARVPIVLEAIRQLATISNSNR